MQLAAKSAVKISRVWLRGFFYLNSVETGQTQLFEMNSAFTGDISMKFGEQM